MLFPLACFLGFYFKEGIKPEPIRIGNPGEPHPKA